MIWFRFIICAGIIFFAGKRVAKYGDIIAEKTGLGGLWIGLVLVAIATSLPEVAVEQLIILHNSKVKRQE